MNRWPILTFASLIIAALFINCGPSNAQTKTSQSATADYGALLTKYVIRGADGLNRVNYGKWKNTPADRERLSAIIAAMETSKPSAMTRNEAFAYWANFYNAVTLKVVVDAYPVKSIRDIKSTGTSFLDFKSYIGPWRTTRVTVEGRELSLDEIEHGIMRPTFKDPRVHYSVNCASVGCPNLMPKPWDAATLESDLDRAAMQFVNSPRGVAVSGGTITVSSIYSWFEEDFGGSQKGAIAHLSKYASADLLAKMKGRMDYDNHAYDWALNETQ